MPKYHKKKIFDKVDHFICISKNTQKDLIEHYNIKKEKTSVIYLSNFSMTDEAPLKFEYKNPFFLLNIFNIYGTSKVRIRIYNKDERR